MGSIKPQCFLRDTSNLRKLILENPCLPLVISCGEYGYSPAAGNKGEIKELALYDGQWRDKEEYAEQLSWDLSDYPEYKELPDDEFADLIERKVKNAEFVKAIVIYVE